MGAYQPYCPPYTPMVDVLPEGQSGDFAVEHYEITREQASLEHLMSATRRQWGETRDLAPGTYCRLRDLRPRVWDPTVMADTPMERRTNLPIVQAARGRVLVAGLGLGMVLVPILAKPEVEHVTVVERSPDVIGLAGPALRRAIGRRAENRLRIECADIFTWQPPRGARWDVIYFDIWPSIDGGNYEGMKRLHRKFQHRREPGGFLESWRRADCRRLAR
jgi:hypothetical protein